MTINKIDALMERILDATGISSQSELARELEINRSGITHARNNNKIPDKWVVKLFKKFGLNPQWIESGIGNVFINIKSKPPLLTGNDLIKDLNLSPSHDFKVILDLVEKASLSQQIKTREEALGLARNWVQKNHS